ncbi:MAG: DinB family protein [Anaerolineales bacterium]
MSEPQPTNKAELLQRIQSDRARLEKVLAPLDDAALEKPGKDGWAIKDHLAHLTAWRQRAAAGIQGRPAYEGLGLDQSAEGLSEDELNASIQARSHARPAADLVAEFRQANDHIQQLIRDLPESKLFGPQGDERLLGNISGNTYEHDAEHQGWIEERLKGA